jgi:hypothetical protein
MISGLKLLLALVSLGLLATVSAQRTTEGGIVPRSTSASAPTSFRRALTKVTSNSCPALIRESDANSDGKLSQAEYVNAADRISGGDFRNVFSLKFGALPSKLQSIFHDLSCKCSTTAYSATGGEAATSCCDGTIDIAGESQLVEEACIRIQLALRSPIMGRSSSPQTTQDRSNQNLGREDDFSVPVEIPNSFFVSNVIGITASDMVPGFAPHDDLQLGYDILSETVVDFFNHTFTTFLVGSTVLAEIYDMDCPADIIVSDTMLCQSVFATMRVELTNATVNATALAESYAEGMQAILDFGFLNDILQSAPGAPIFIAENGTEAIKPGDIEAPSLAPLGETLQRTPAPSVTGGTFEPTLATNVTTETIQPIGTTSVVLQNITVSNEFVIYNSAGLQATDMIPNSPSYNTLDAAYTLFMGIIYDENNAANFQSSTIQEIVDVGCPEGTESGINCQLVVANHTIELIDPQDELAPLAALATNGTKMAIDTGILHIVLKQNFPQSPINVGADTGSNQRLIISNSFVIANNQSITADMLGIGNAFFGGLYFAYELMNAALYLERNQSDIFYALFSTVVEEVLDVPCPDSATADYVCQSILATYGVDLEPLPADPLALQQNLAAMTEDAVQAGALQQQLAVVDGSSPFVIIAIITVAPTPSPTSVPTNVTLVEITFSVSSYLLVSTFEPLTNAAVADTVGSAYSNLAELIVQGVNNSTEFDFTGTLLRSNITSTRKVTCAVDVIGKTCYVVYAGYYVSGVGQSASAFTSAGVLTLSTNELMENGVFEQLINQVAPAEQQYSIDAVLETEPVTIVTEFTFAISLLAGANRLVGSDLLGELADVVGAISISLNGDASASVWLLPGTGSVDDLVEIDCPDVVPVFGTAAPITAAPTTAAPVSLAPANGSFAPVTGGMINVTAAPVTAAPVTTDTMSPAEAPISADTEAPATVAPISGGTEAPDTTDTMSPAEAPISADTEAPATVAPISGDAEAPATSAPVGTDTEAPIPVSPVTIAPVTSAPFDGGKSIGRALLTSSTRLENFREGIDSTRLLMRKLQDDLNQTEDGATCFACYGSYEVLLLSVDNATSLQLSITNGFELGISSGELQNAINSITGLSTSTLTILLDDDLILSPPTSAPTTSAPSSSPQAVKLEIETAFILASSKRLSASELQSSQPKTALAIAFDSVAKGVAVDLIGTHIFGSTNLTKIEETACPSGNEGVEVCYLVYGSYSTEVLLEPDSSEEATKQLYRAATEESIDRGSLETFLKNVDAESPFLILEGLQPSAITQAPSFAPAFPSIVPSGAPSTNPSILPTVAQSNTPSRIPSTLPSLPPSIPPSSLPTYNPSTSMPSVNPTSSSSPSSVPSSLPSSIPSCLPSSSSSPTSIPTASPSGSSFPSWMPSGRPSGSQTPSFEPSMSADASLLTKGIPKSREKGLSGGASAGIVIGILLLVLVCVVGGYFGWQHRDEVKEKIPFLKGKDDYNDNYGEDVNANAKEELLAIDDDSKDAMDDMTDDDADVTDDEGAKSSQFSSRGRATPAAAAVAPSKAAWGGLALFSLFRGKKAKEEDENNITEKDIENLDPLDKSSRSESDEEESSCSLFFGEPVKAEKPELHTDGESSDDFSDYDKSPVAKSHQAVVEESSHEHEGLESGSESDYESDGYDDDDNCKVPPANFNEVRGSSSTVQMKNKGGGKPSHSDDDSGSYSSSSRSSSSHYSEEDSGSDYTSERDTDRKKGRQSRR